jgi:pimeloyl-ACP methyl ester carboxylesterase
MYLHLLSFLWMLPISTSLSTLAATMTRHTWTWRGHPIAYYEKNGNRPDQQPVLLLNGFGVGSFHQELLMQSLDNDAYRLYAIDYLGQGASWPIDCQDGMSNSERGLCYSGNTWVEQLVDFIQTQFPAPQQLHLVGNSVGGHLCVFVAQQIPDHIATLSLLNATPVWGLNLPGWSGELPVPAIPRAIGRWAFDRMRDKTTIQLFLQNCYHNKEAFDSKLAEQIYTCTTGTGGHAAFASILWSPPITLPASSDDDTEKALSFRQCVSRIQCPVLLAYGAKDPWCTPAIAQQILNGLPAECTAQYVELSNVGHCPNHEAPQAVATILQLFWKQPKGPILSEPLEIKERWGVTRVTQKFL